MGNAGVGGRRESRRVPVAGSESGSLQRIEEAFLRTELEAAGFKLVAGNSLRNPADPRDRNIPEPAQPKDQFILKFVWP